MFNGFYITEKGREYIARSMSDRALVFTRGEFGNGVLEEGESPQTATKLKSSLSDLPISKKTSTLSTTTITTQFSNLKNGSLLPAFHLTEAGLYGKLKDLSGRDDDENPEELLLYAYVPVDQSDYIQQKLTEFIINWPIGVSQTASVSILIDDSLVYPTLDDYTKKIAQIGEKLAAVATSFVAEDVSLTKDMFTEDTTYKVFPYKATIPLDGVTAEAIADVVFGPDEAESGIFGSITETQEGAVVLYAREIPEDEEIIIPTIEIRYATGANSGADTGIEDDVLDSGDIATDDEVDDTIDDIFGEGSSDVPGGDTGGDVTDPDDNIATDEEVGDVIDDIFGTGDGETGGDDSGGGSGDDSGGGSGDEPGGDDTTGDNIATDEEVGDVIEDIFG